METTELRVEGTKLREEVKELRAAATAMTEATQLWARQWAELEAMKLELAKVKRGEAGAQGGKGDHVQETKLRPLGAKRQLEAFCPWRV